MNTKTGKIGIRLGALLLSLCLIIGMMPVMASAAQTDTGRSLQLVDNGTAPNINGYDSSNNSYDYIYYGTWEGSPIKWRVLDDKTNTGDDGLFLLTDLAHIKKGEGLRFDVTKPDDPGMSIWETSDARIWCTEFYTNNLSALEQVSVLATTKSDEEFVAGIYDYRFAASYNILNGDKVFFLSAEEASNAEYGFVDDYARRADSTMSVVWGTDSFTVRGGEEGSVWNGSWWLRNDLPYGGHTQAGFVYYWGGIGIEQISEWPMAARPAFNLDLDSVLFTSAAYGGKSSDVGNLTLVNAYDGNEWKVTVRDKSRNLKISDVEITGDSVTFSYSNAVTGLNEYLSSVIVDNGVLTYYGRILALDGVINKDSATASIDIPSGVTLSDTTKLYIFNEQANEDRMTDYASRLIDVLNPEAPEPDNADPITLPVRVLEEGDLDYSPAPELSATFTPDSAVTVGEFNQWQGLAIDYYNPMVDAELSVGYDIQAAYTVSIPLTGYAGETLSGTLTIPLPERYDGASARIKGGASASSHTATTVTFPLTLEVSGGVAEKFELVIEYKEKTGGHVSPSPSSPDPLGYRLPLASEAEEPSASSGFESDTTSDFTVDGAYQFRITSLDGTAPVMTASNASFRVELASREGNDYFFKIYAQGAAGSAAVISVNGTALLTATVGGSASGVISDTTHPFTVAQGGTYQFRLTASERPAFAAGSPSFTVEYAGRIGSDYFYKVRAIGKPGDGCGLYINREPAPAAAAAPA